MRVDYINYPFVFTDNGRRIPIDDIDGTPRVGSELAETKHGYQVMGITSDSECVNGVCPVR